MAENCPAISIIIPVFDDYVRLDRCLSALEAQTASRDNYEVIVVDNGSSSPVSAVIERHDWVKWERCLQRGSYAARNLGITVACGKILCFTDSDTIPARDWVERASGAVAQRGGGVVVAGKVRLFTESDSGRWNVVESYERLFAFRQEHYVNDRGFGVTANLIVPRLAIEVAGPFRDDLLSNGDLEWGQRAQRAGVSIVYDGTVVVAHPARTSISELKIKIRRVVDGRIRRRGKRRSNLRAALAEFTHELVPPLGAYKRIWVNRSDCGGCMAFRMAVLVTYLRYYRACHRGLARLHR